MALIGESASQRNLGHLQVAAAQERLGSSHADAAHIFADGAAEMAMELAADLDGMPSGTAREFSEGKPRGFLFPQHFSNAQQPGGNQTAARR
jgi:hypothetical protein